MLKNRTRLQIERLEDRIVPTVSASYYDGSLYLTGKTNGALNIMGTGAPYQFSVTDNAAPVGAGTYNISGNLIINLQYEKGNLTLDLNGEQLPGSVLINLGVGQIAPAAAPYNVNIYDSTGTGTGEIGGSVTLVGGNGQEFFNVGVNPAGPTQDPIILDNNLTVAPTRGNSSFTGNQLDIGDGTTIYGSMTTSYVSQVAIGSNTAGAALVNISGSVNINDAGSPKGLSAVDTGVIQGSLNVVGTSTDDIFTLEEATAGGGFVGGNLSVNLGAGAGFGDRINLLANTEVQGNTNLSAGNNLNLGTGDQFQLRGTLDQNVTINMGNTKNSIYFTPLNIGDPTPIVNGSMTINQAPGLGEVVMGQAATGEFNGEIRHNLTVNLGSGNNGTDIDPMIIAPIVTENGGPTVNYNGIGGIFTWTSGNGADFLQLGDSIMGNPSTNYTYNFVVNVHFGTHPSQLAIDLGTAAADEGIGTIYGHVHLNVAGTFVTISGTTGTPFTVGV